MVPRSGPRWTTVVLPGPYHVTAHVISAIVLCVGRVPTKPQAIAVIAYLIRNSEAYAENCSGDHGVGATQSHVIGS